MGSFEERDRIHDTLRPEGNVRTVVDRHGASLFDLETGKRTRAASTATALKRTLAGGWACSEIEAGIVRVEASSGLPDESIDYPVWVAV